MQTDIDPVDEKIANIAISLRDFDFPNI